MSKTDWIFMPHPAHFIGGHDCRFHLATKVGNYIVSTVGEYLPDSRVRDTLKVGLEFQKIGSNRLYETMVFKAKENPAVEFLCCPFIVDHAGDDLDFEGYNDPTSAYLGHLKYCEIWSEK